MTPTTPDATHNAVTASASIAAAAVLVPFVSLLAEIRRAAGLDEGGAS